MRVTPERKLSLQQWMEYCPAGRDPTCPLCKRSISCPAHDVHRLYFQSAGSDSTEPQVSPSRSLQTAVEDPKHVNCSSAFRKSESKLAAAFTFVYDQLKGFESQVAANLPRTEKAKAAIVIASSKLAQCRQGLTSVQKSLQVQEENQAMARVLVSMEQARWARVLREDRENLEARVQELVELAKMWHDV